MFHLTLSNRNVLSDSGLNSKLTRLPFKLYNSVYVSCISPYSVFVFTDGISTSGDIIKTDRQDSTYHTVAGRIFNLLKHNCNLISSCGLVISYLNLLKLDHSCQRWNIYVEKCCQPTVNPLRTTRTTSCPLYSISFFFLTAYTHTLHTGPRTPRGDSSFSTVQNDLSCSDSQRTAVKYRTGVGLVGKT